LAYIQGEERGQYALFPSTLDELIPADHICRVIEAFVDRLDMAALGFGRAEPEETGRPGYDPRDLLKLYLYGYLQQVRSSRRLENECRRNVEAMWLLHRLTPDHKSIAEFRRLHSEAVTQVGAELIQFARSLGLVRGEWVAVDGSKFRAVSSVGSVREREAVKRYLESLESADQAEELIVDPGKVAEALKKLQKHREPEAKFMRTTAGAKVPAYNVQAAVDSQHALIVAQQVTTEATDNRCLLPMAEAARVALSNPEVLHVVADAGYSNGEQAEACEAKGILPHVPANRGVNNHGDGNLFDRSAFQYQPEQDAFLCPSGQMLKRQQISRKDRSVYYAGRPEICGACLLKPRCTLGAQRMVSRHWHDEVLQRMQQRATPEVMRLRRSTVEHPFATLKYQIFGHPRFLLRGRRGAQAEMSLAVVAYNLKRMMNVLGQLRLASALASI
jgi:transposase